MRIQPTNIPVKDVESIFFCQIAWNTAVEDMLGEIWLK